MTPERWEQVRAIFDAAIELPDGEIEPYVKQACGEDKELYREVMRLIGHHRETGMLDSPLFRPPPPPASPVFHEGLLVAGRYRILRHISRGGMGEVYEARDLELEITVALKTLLPEIAEDGVMIARFKKEIALGREISHPNVCKVYDLGRHEAPDARPVIFFTMEFLEGETLATRLKEYGAMNEADALPLLRQMAAGLDAAHGAGVIHRDFKPSNVMLAPSGSGLRTVITDFGLARRQAGSDSPTSTLSKHIAGTLDYMSRELLTGGAPSFASDIYALGMTAYKMVTGTLPFAAHTPMEAAALRVQRAVPSPCALRPSLDRNWERAILRALDAKPANRFASAGDFVAALEGEARTRTIPIPPITRLTAAIAAILVIATLASALGWRAWVSANHRLSKEAQVLYGQGTADIAAGAYFAAGQALGEAVKDAPHAPQVRARLAESLLELDSPQKAGEQMLAAKREDLSWLSKGRPPAGGSDRPRHHARLRGRRGEVPADRARRRTVRRTFRRSRTRFTKRR